MRCRAASALRRADIDHEIDVAPVDAEIERRRAHDRAQAAARHRLFDLAPLRYVERAVMQRDREIVVVDVPELLKDASAWLRVLTKTSVVRCALMSR
jgi:hypothetical protein